MTLTPPSGRWLRLFCFWLVVARAVAAMPAPPPAVKAGTDPEVRFLYPAGPIYKQDKVFPLVLELSNQGPEAKTYRGSWTLNVSMPEPLPSVELEPGEKRRFPLYFPRNEVAGAGTISLNGQPYSTELQPCPRASTTAVLSPQGEKFDYLRTLKLEVDPNVAVATPAEGEAPAQPPLVPLAAMSLLEPELLPEGWPMLSCLDVIIAYDTKSMALSKLQKAALISWVCQGGRLVLVSDGLPEEFRDTPFEAHLPMRPTGVITDAKAGLVQLVGEPTADSETLATHNERPLLLRKPLMRGQVFLLTAPLTSLGPLSVEKAEKLWKQVLPEGPTDPSGHYNYNYRYNYHNSPLANTLRDIPELPRAGPGWVALFLVVYALIVGPLNLSLLRRRDKMLWSFVTVPAIAMLFAGGAYVLNRTSRSSVPVLRELGLLQVKNGDRRGIGISEALFYSPAGGRYLIDCSPDAICHSTTYSYSRKEPFGMYDLLPDGGMQAAITMGTWDIFTLGTESLIRLPAPLTGSYKNGTLVVNSPFSTGADEAQLFHPEKGASATFALKGGSQSEKLELKDPTNYSKFDKLGTPADPDAHPGRLALLQNLNNQASNFFKPGHTYLLFWTDQLVSPLEPKAPALHRGEFLVALELQT